MVFKDSKGEDIYMCVSTHLEAFYPVYNNSKNSNHN